jgi:hypothetical protein
MVTKVIRLRNVQDKRWNPPELPKCLVCSSPNVRLWTLDSGRRAAPMYLCPVHDAPLEALMDAAGNEPPSRQKPMRDEGKQDPIARAPRRRTMRPLEWAPPPKNGTGAYKH